MGLLLSLSLVLVLLAPHIGAANAECHPECRWQCDDPVCPAQCHPVCERPKCQMQCEQPPCADCTVHCERPACTVRCPKDMCEKNDCPQCETVCSPAKCHSECIAPEPICSPLCEETKCDWKCKKPTLCPKPKCELQCERPACDANPPISAVLAANNAAKCCACTAQNIGAAVNSADMLSRLADASMRPTFVELVHTMKLKETTGETTCCPCTS